MRPGIIEIINLIETKDSAIIDLINDLSNQDRRMIRAVAELLEVKELPRNLYYNYQTQTWID